jgi:hypothetical protein
MANFTQGIVPQAMDCPLRYAQTGYLPTSTAHHASPGPAHPGVCHAIKPFFAPRPCRAPSSYPATPPAILESPSRDIQERNHPAHLRICLHLLRAPHRRSPILLRPASRNLRNLRRPPPPRLPPRRCPLQRLRLLLHRLPKKRRRQTLHRRQILQSLRRIKLRS